MKIFRHDRVKVFRMQWVTTTPGGDIPLMLIGRRELLKIIPIHSYVTNSRHKKEFLGISMEYPRIS